MEYGMMSRMKDVGKEASEGKSEKQEMRNKK